MELFVDFDIILIAIFVTIFITGYIRGGGIELLRVLKVVIPFFVLYFYRDQITNLLFSSKNSVDFVYTILPNIPYRNTIAALSTQIGVYIVVYIFLAIFLWRLGKFVLDERIEYIFGRYNSILGGIFSVIRMYIIVSVFIIPFYALNFTNHSDPLTSIILDNPPNFSKFGVLIKKSKPTVDKFNEVSASLKIMDIKSLEKYTTLLTDVNSFLSTNEDNAYDVYLYLKENNMIDEIFENKSEFLYYYVKNYEIFNKLEIKNKEINKKNNDLSQIISQYNQVFIWAYENDIKNKESLDEIVSSFIENYPYISANTDDKLTLEVLSKLKLKTQLYIILKNWLINSYRIQINTDYDLINDNNLEFILDNYDLYKDDLINAIRNMDAKEIEKEDIIKQVNKFSNFHKEYKAVYKPQIQLYDELLEGVSFKYKLAFSIMKDKKLNKVVDDNIDKDPIMYLFTLDSLNFIDIFYKNDNQIYYDAGKVYVALFLIDLKITESGLDIEKISYDDIYINFQKIKANEYLFDKTKKDVNKVLKTLLIEKNNESYLEFIIRQGYTENNLLDEMLSSEEIKDFLTYDNYILLKHLNEKIKTGSS